MVPAGWREQMGRGDPEEVAQQSAASEQSLKAEKVAARDRDGDTRRTDRRSLAAAAALSGQSQPHRRCPDSFLNSVSYFEYGY